MAGHTSGNRVDGIFYPYALFLQNIGHFAQDMLRLRNRHAVSGHDDNAFGLLHHIGRIFGRATFPRTLLLGFTAGDSGLRAKAARDHADEAAVHGLAHDVGQNRARRADQCARDNHRRVVQREAHGGGGPTGIAVQHRHHDGHIRAADGNDEQEANEESKRGNSPENPGALVHGEVANKAQDRRQSAQVNDMAQRQEDRRARHFARQLQESDD